jgi:hypothetical protein
MDPRTPPQLEMTPDGRFRMPERPALSVRIQRTALIVALLAGVLATALLALWFALVLIPVAAGAALVAWVAFKLRGGPLRPR